MGSYNYTISIGHLGEQLTLNQWVLGSSPRWCTRSKPPQRIPLWGLAFGLHARRTRTGRRRRSAGTNSPVDCWLARGRVPGECGGQQGLTGGSLTESVGLLFCCYSPGRRVGAPSGTRTARARRPLRRAKRLLRSLFRARESPRGMRRLAGFGGRCPQRIPLWGLAFGLHARRVRTGRRHRGSRVCSACWGSRACRCVRCG